MARKKRSNNKRKTKNQGRESHSASNKTAANVNAKPPNKPSKAFQTIISRYKNATNRFVDYIAKACPSEMNEKNGKITANSFRDAADVLVKNNHIMDCDILKDLELAIRTRKKVQISIYGGGDAGHQYFLEVLTYCWYLLRSLPTSSKNEGSGSKSEKTKSVSVEEVTETLNPFQVLTEDSDDEEEEGKEMIFPTEPVERPSLPSGSEPMSLEELMQSDERIDAVLFLLSLNEMMGSVASKFSNVLEAFRRRHSAQSALSDSSIVGELLNATVATNFAIQKVQELEMDLMLQHEHFTTPYRLLATAVLPELTQQVTRTVRKYAAKQGCTEKDVSMFLGDCMETFSRSDTDPFNPQEKLVDDFCKQWTVNATGKVELLHHYKSLHKVLAEEVPITCSECGPESYSWFKNLHYIGGDRAIYYTLDRIQGFRNVIYNSPQPISVNRDGDTWKKTPGKAERLPGTRILNLEFLLMTDILPDCVNICREVIRYGLSFENELCPLFVLMREYVTELESPLSWSITFAMHALLTGILEVEPVFDDLVPMCKTVFDDYFERCEWASDLAIENENSTSSTWRKNMEAVVLLEFLPSIYNDRMLFNPLCAGTLFAYLSLSTNLRAGCVMMDCHAQLRVTLHLFNALLKTGILERGEIPLLDSIYDSFYTSKAIWGGSCPPERGEFFVSFDISYGINIVEARMFSNQAKERIRETQHQPNRKNRLPHSGPGRRRQTVLIKPWDISKSFRRICTRDFHGVIDEYYTAEQREEFYHYRLMVNTNDALDAMVNERCLLSLHLPYCSMVVEQFVNSLAHVMQWESLIEEYGDKQHGKRHGKRLDKGNDERHIFCAIFVKHLLGALDFADDPFNYEFMGVPLGQTSSEFMIDFFNENTSEAFWFGSVPMNPYL